MKIFGIVLVVLGILALVYQGFSYHHPEQVAKVGSVELTSDKKENVWVPPAVGAVLLIAGIALIAIPRRSL